jgi:hypothetical protein
VDVSVDVADQAGPLGQHVHGSDATGTEALDTISQLVVDVGRGHHGLVALWSGSIHNAVEDSPFPLVEDSPVAFSGLSPVAFWRFIGDSSRHSKTSVVWNSEDVFLPKLFQNLRGFSSFFSDFHQNGL